MVGYAPREHQQVLKEPSYQAAHANAWLNLQVGAPMRSGGIPHRGPRRILRIVPHDTMHDGTLHSPSVHGIRIYVESHEPHRALRPLHTLFCRRNCWWFCCGAYDASGRHQDITADSRKCYRRRAEECVGPMAGSKNYPPKRRVQRVLSRTKTQNHHHNAQHRHLLVSLTWTHFPNNRF